MLIKVLRRNGSNTFLNRSYCQAFKFINATNVRTCAQVVNAALTTPLNRILIANRGEIACRIIKTAKRMGIQAIAVYSDADEHSRHVQMADCAYHLGPAQSSQSYLNQCKLMEIALKSNVQAIHPGYGFLSENTDFATRCSQNGIIFIGPPAKAIKDMGIKSTSKIIMCDAGVPVIPGYHGENQDDQHLLQEAIKIGFPVMIKAVRGGGGKGMRISMSEQDFLEQLASARRESKKSFDDEVVLIEKFVTSPRHVEVQIFGDQHGNYVYLFERDCSIQRRHQKVIEEAPGPGITDAIRKEIGEAAVRAAKAVNYVGAGTVEFIYDEREKKFYFMEMNTRLQVEHPITEMITGTDLVEWQLRVAGGEPLPLSQQQLKLHGHAFEARIYAEDPFNNFMPGAGKLIDIFTAPIENDPSIRIETGVRSGDEVSVHYDPMIAKLVVWDQDRVSALRKLNYALSKYNITGLKTNINYLLKLTSNKDFIDGKVSTNFIEEHKDQLLPSTVSLTDENPLSLSKKLCIALIGSIIDNQNKFLDHNKTENKQSAFNNYDSFHLNGLCKANEKIKLKFNDEIYSLELYEKQNQQYEIKINDKLWEYLHVHSINKLTNELTISLNYEKQIKCRALNYLENNIALFSETGVDDFEIIVPEYYKQQLYECDENVDDTATGAVGSLTAPMPGVVEKILVSEGQQMNAGEPIVIMMAMKMEYILKANRSVIIDKVLFKVGENVAKGAKLVNYKVVTE